MKKITLLFLFFLGTISATYGQLSQNFEGAFPPTGWTIESTNPTNTWNAQTIGLVGQGAQVNWIAEAQDESLISPVFTVPSGSPSLKFKVSLSYFWAVTPNNNYDASASISTDGGTTWTELWNETALGVFTSFTVYDIDIPLSTYAGQTNAKIKFQYVGNDGADLYLDQVAIDVPPAVAPDCATLTAPANAATGVVYSAPVVLTWDAPTTGGPVDSYDVFLDTNATPTTLLGNQTAVTRSVTGLLPSTTYYWRAVPKNAAGSAASCAIFSFTTSANLFAPYCGPVDFTLNVEPITLVNFAGINNVTSEVLNGTPDHELFTTPTGNVTAGSAYTITLKGNTDGATFTNRFMVYADWNQDGDFADTDEAYTIAQTITGSTGIDAIQATQSLQVPPTALVGNTRLRVKKIFGTTNYADPCLGTGYGQVEDYTIAVAAAPSDLPDYANLQFPATATFAQGGSVTVYGQVYEGGLTDVAPNIVGQAPGIQAWIGVSTTNTNPNTWTTWTPATWNSGNVSNNDEYQLSIGTALAPGTYYYATRFQLNGGVFVYGGINASAPNNGNFWDGATFGNGVLTVTAPLPPANDECAGATALTPGGVFADNAITTTNLAATNTDASTPSCQTNFANNVWYSVVVPASGSITIETQANAGSGYTDSVISVFSGTCASLTEVDCNDDTVGGNNFFSTLNLTGQTPGDTLLISVWRFSLGTGVDGTFKISAYDASLGNGTIDNANFAFYPNPVTSVLNLSYNKEISNVEVFNLLGQKVSSNVFNATDAQIDMTNLSNGAYMVKVTSENVVKTIRVIKQ
ncbi:GEVED domain-containing protein [Flavobacterium sp. 25HG05S-40]|uniref:GEVED domain-containing protein n=1 Tax=Flavobacterium sp. 25HG05S-40 TaxID=3458682 RepID=UPI004044968A